MNEDRSCEYACRNEWGPAIDCAHPDWERFNVGYCDKENCPKMGLVKK